MQTAPIAKATKRFNSSSFMIRKILLCLVCCLCLAYQGFAQSEEIIYTDIEPEPGTPTAESTDTKPQDDQQPLGEDTATTSTADTDDNIPVTPQEQTEEPASPEITPPEPQKSNFRDTAILHALNKITARTSPYTAKLGETIFFGNLAITLHSCWQSPPEEEPENKALLEIWEEIPGEPREKIFSGWMFSSSPLISAPEHPVYDITLLECTGEAITALPKDSEHPMPQ